jgi:hypothetical protein
VLREIFLVIASLLSPESNLIIEDKCDYIEFNDFGISENGSYSSQIIFWEWKNAGVAHVQRDLAGKETGLIQYGEGFVVVDWRMIRSERSPNATRVMISRCHRGSGLVEVLFWDSSDRVVRKVVAKWIVRSRGYDREQANLEVFPSKNRRGLFEPK